ncbi:putative pentatricopeptide repeat-containing protein At5g37570 [Amborella trichopoda]|uniref:putative pentatricopeptide repeat-containing protein At5g37570 n=1 Tax=Amborella trichopoda TaxID=13333 RepID=UPI0005D3DDC0|nr:putative pentatricopeptide repeat-containing protein At5g37570 [Amborella trichopoda]|eukprot:XP_011625296.1 putative pentatricopeptide repeat-containing protein At5g37570 [Amborella trichopoda]
MTLHPITLNPNPKTLKSLLQTSKTLTQLKPLHCHLTRNAKAQAQGQDNSSTLFLWTLLIRAYTRAHHSNKALATFLQVTRAHLSPTHFTLASLLHACSSQKAIWLGSSAHACFHKAHKAHNPILETSLLDMYVKCGLMNQACQVFDEMLQRDVVSWTVMVDGLAKLGFMAEAKALFDYMPQRNVVSWTAIVAGYVRNGDMCNAKEVFDKMPDRSAMAFTAMISGYCKIGQVGLAREVFDSMGSRDLGSWGAMIAGYAQNWCCEEAIELFYKMRNRGVRANEIAMVGVVSAASKIGKPEVSDSVSEYLEVFGIELTVFLANALIHMYMKCGVMEKAKNVFDEMGESRDIISYSTMIAGLADHGHGFEALGLFENMIKNDLRPNAVTFISVLSACSHAGLVEQGCRYFKIMREDYGVKPSVEHYACLVDLLGRAGMLEEAYELILDMEETPDSAIWGALLGACRLHGNIELGEIVAEKLFELEPDNTGNYVLLAHIYASKEEWAEAERVRRKIRDRGMRKSPGCSWI